MNKAILDLPPRDHSAHALAAQIVNLTLESQKEIERYVEARDWRGAHYREEIWREAVIDACLKANAVQFEAYRHVQQELTDVLVSELRTRTTPLVDMPLPPAMPESTPVDAVGGPAITPEEMEQYPGKWIDPPTANLMADKLAIAYASPDWSKLQGVHWIEGEPATTFADRISAALAHQEAEREEGAAMLNDKGEAPHGTSI